MRSRFYLTAMCCVMFSMLFSQPEYGTIKIVDDYGNPLSNAFIACNTFIVGITDDAGCCDVNISTYDTLKVVYMGFESIPFMSSQITKGNVVVFSMKKIENQIEAININYKSPWSLLIEAQKDFINLKGDLSLIGQGRFQKIVYQNNKCVGFEQHDGVFMFANDKHKREKRYLRSFIPEHSRVSNFFTLEFGVYKPLLEKFSANNTYNANSSIWDKAIVAHEIYGPQNNNMLKYYDIRVIEQNDTSIIFFFEINKEKYPTKIPIYGRGLMHIDIKKAEILEIAYEHFNFIHHLMFNAKNQLTPAYQCEFKIEYFRENKSFPKSISINRKWLDDIKDPSKYVFWPKPVRPKPSVTKLQESEMINIEEITECKEFSIEGLPIHLVIPLMSTNYFVHYDSFYWAKHKHCYRENIDNIFEDLSSDIPIEIQFVNNDKKWKMGVDYNEYFIISEFQPLFYKTWDISNEIINSIKIKIYEK